MVNNTFKAHTDAAFEKAKAYYAAKDEFKFSSESKGTKIYTKDVSDTHMPVTWGEITFVGITQEEILEKLRDANFRKVWDSRFEGAEILEKFDDDGGFLHSNQKGAMFVSGRDFSVAYHVYREGDTIFYVQTSVEDSRTPLVNGRVRGHLTVAAWILKKVDNGTEVVYITHVNPNGTVPGTLLKLVATETPACAGGLYEAMKKK
ncbi:hypothetical protein DFJ73DRAFT_854971 [Zopfochytrium polystomum]|nr:hypothetical protein DFJ73DRAFT_854971 [Zopfochytrium polystomum]